jgi:signal transduction histidine kinase
MSARRIDASLPLRERHVERLKRYLEADRKEFLSDPVREACYNRMRTTLHELATPLTNVKGYIDLVYGRTDKLGSVSVQLNERAYFLGVSQIVTGMQRIFEDSRFDQRVDANKGTVNDNKIAKALCGERNETNKTLIVNWMAGIRKSCAFGLGVNMDDPSEGLGKKYNEVGGDGLAFVISELRNYGESLGLKLHQRNFIATGRHKDMANSVIEVVNRRGRDLIWSLADTFMISEPEKYEARVEGGLSTKSILEEVCEVQAGASTTKEIASDVFEVAGDDVNLRTDKHVFRLIVSNVIGNAFKYSEEGGKHKKVGILIEESDKFLMMTVADQGIGVADSNILDRINAPGVYAIGRSSNAENSSIQGTGYGLGLCKKIMDERYVGASLEASSGGAGKGMTVRLKIPKDGFILKSHQD